MESPLVSADWLAARLGSPSVRVIEVSSMDDDSFYRAGHIPGAVWWFWKLALWHDMRPGSGLAIIHVLE